MQIDGDGATLNNDGQIIGTGDQRNGTVYTNATATDFTLNNTGTIDAGAGNLGAGFSAEGVAEGTVINVNNSGTIQGRGQAGAGLATAGDGIRFERTRVAGALDATTSAVFSGTIENSGTIASESLQGTAAGIRFVNGVSFNGTINNSGTISGAHKTASTSAMPHLPAAATLRALLSTIQASSPQTAAHSILMAQALPSTMLAKSSAQQISATVRSMLTVQPTISQSTTLKAASSTQARAIPDQDWVLKSVARQMARTLSRS